MQNEHLDQWIAHNEHKETHKTRNAEFCSTTTSLIHKTHSVDSIYIHQFLNNTTLIPISFYRHFRQCLGHVITINKH